MYKPITKVQLIKGGNVIKQGHDFTLEFNLFDDEGDLVDLTGFTTTYKIALDNGGVVAEGAATVIGKGHISITITDDIGYGSGMRIEFTAKKSGVEFKFPADDFMRITITPSLDDLKHTKVNTITVEQFKKQIDAATDYATIQGDRAKVHSDNIDNVMKNGPVQTVNGQTGTVTGLAYQSEVDNVKTQLAEKANQNEVRKDTNLQPINVKEMDTETKQLFTGGAVAVVDENAVGNENIKPKAVTREKTDFISVGKNILDASKFEDGFTVNTNSGLPSASSGRSLSPPTPVISGATYTQRYSTSLCFYESDSDSSFISGVPNDGTSYTAPGVFSPRQINVPVNANFIRTSVLLADKETYQIELGNVATIPEKHRYVYDKLIVSEKDLDDVLKDAVNPVKLANRDIITESNIKSFERYKVGSIIANDYFIAKRLAAIQDIKIVGIDPSIPVKMWMLCRNFSAADFRYRFIFSKKINGVWSYLIDSGIAFDVVENPLGATEVSYEKDGIKIKMRVQYSLLENDSRFIEGNATDDPTFVVSPKFIHLTESSSGGGGTAYDQSLNTTDDVEFKTILAEAIQTKGNLPIGTLANPPTGLFPNDPWFDTTDSETHPVLRVMK